MKTMQTAMLLLLVFPLAAFAGDIPGPLLGETPPPAFTGLWVNKYPSGELRSKTEYRNGVPHGTHRYWHHPTGVLMREDSYCDGKLHGKRLSWHLNGAKASEEQWKDGERHSVQLHWFPNGWKEAETHYEHGKQVRTVPNPGADTPREWGIAQAQADIAKGDLKILYWGIMWGWGWPPKDKKTGLPVVIMAECFVLPESETKMNAYNETVRAYVAEHDVREQEQ